MWSLISLTLIALAIPLASGRPKPEGTLSFGASQPLTGIDRRPSFNANYEHPIYKGKNLDMRFNIGGKKTLGEIFRPEVGFQTKIKLGRRFRDRAGTLTLMTKIPLLMDLRHRPSLSAGYVHDLWKGHYGDVGIAAKGEQTPGDPTKVGVGAQTNIRVPGLADIKN